MATRNFIFLPKKIVAEDESKGGSFDQRFLNIKLFCETRPTKSCKHFLNYTFVVFSALYSSRKRDKRYTGTPGLITRGGASSKRNRSSKEERGGQVQILKPRRGLSTPPLLPTCTLYRRIVGALMKRIALTCSTIQYKCSARSD